MVIDCERLVILDIENRTDVKKKLLVALLTVTCLSAIVMSGCSSDECKVELTLPPSYGFAINATSDDVFIAQKGSITVEQETGSPDGAVFLVDAEESDNPYVTDEKYITPGAPVTFSVDKGSAYRLLFKAGNDGSEYITATFFIRDVKVAS